MGEKRYVVEGYDREHTITFTEDDDTYGCLCTFPHNNRAMGKIIDIEDVRSLALLGAAVCIISRGQHKNEWMYLPFDVPGWIRTGIDKIIGYKPEEETEPDAVPDV